MRRRLAADAALKLDANSAAGARDPGTSAAGAGNFDKAIAELQLVRASITTVRPERCRHPAALAEGSLEPPVETGDEHLQLCRQHAVSRSVKDDPHCWQAYALSGGRLLEKYNRRRRRPNSTAGRRSTRSRGRCLALLARLALDRLNISTPKNWPTAH